MVIGEDGIGARLLLDDPPGRKLSFTVNDHLFDEREEVGGGEGEVQAALDLLVPGLLPGEGPALAQVQVIEQSEVPGLQQLLPDELPARGDGGPP